MQSLIADNLFPIWGREGKGTPFKSFQCVLLRLSWWCYNMCAIYLGVQKDAFHIDELAANGTRKKSIRSEQNNLEGFPSQLNRLHLKKLWGKESLTMNRKLRIWCHLEK